MFLPRLFLIVGLLWSPSFFPLRLYAQETNYWFHNYGAGSYLKGGIEVGGIQSNSAVYYNPGALSFLNGEYFEAQADIIGIDILNIENGAGDGIPINYFLLDATPSLFAYSRQSKKNSKFTYGINILTKTSSNIFYNLNYEEVGSYLKPESEPSVFQGNYEYSNRVKENWIMGALSWKLSENIGFGFSSILNIRTQDFRRNYNGDAIFKKEADEGLLLFSKMSAVNYNQKFSMRSLGLIFKPGVQFKKDNFSGGITITTPNIPLGLLRNTANRKNYAVLPDVEENTFLESAVHDFFSGVYKTPLILEFGGEYFFEKSSIGLAIAWFSEVNPYQMIEANKNSKTFENLPQTDPEFSFPVMAHKSVVNFGIVYTRNLKNDLVYTGSLRTDFNYFDDQKLDRQEDFVPNFTYWDIYHLTSGLYFKGPKTELSFGLDYGFGYSSGDAQIVNLTNPTQERGLTGQLNNNTQTLYNYIGFVFGLNYSIDRLEGLKKN